MNPNSLPSYAEPQAFLKGKPRSIVVNNVYHKPLGSDPFLCGQMPMERRWHIPLLQLKRNIEYLSRFTKTIFIVGGEPRFHPDWANVLEMMFYFDGIDFVVQTHIDPMNHKPPVDRNNVRYWGDPICKRGRPAEPVLVAAIDILPGQGKRFYWNEARKYCKFWHHAPSPIYDDKAYYCVVAASYERMLGLETGWKIDAERDCFDRSAEEVAVQAENFCYRCGCSLFFKDPSMFPEQNLIDGAVTSVTNLKQISVNSRLKPYYPKQFI